MIILNNSKYLYCIVIFFFININYLNANDLQNNKIFLVNKEKLQNIPLEFFSFLEGKSHEITIDDLKKAEWKINDKALKELNI